jgi:hypothetical protein
MAGHYRLVRLLGTGPCSEVYLGQHLLVPEMHYAIKKPATTANEQVETLYRRAGILSQLAHPAILKRYALEGPEPAVRLMFAPQGSLYERARSAQVSDLQVIVLSTMQLALALAYAHAQGIVHGNLKAQNILFDHQGDVLLSDFDVPTGAFLQSPRVLHALPYRAPEQERGHAWPATDQYQLAHLTENWLQQAGAELHASPQAIDALRRTLRTAQHTQATQRYPDMHHFARELAQVAAMLPQTVRRHSSPPARRHGSLPIFALLLLLVILGGGLLAGLSLLRRNTGTPAARPALSPQALYQQLTHTRPTLTNPSAGNGVGQWILTQDRAGGSCSLHGTTLSLASSGGSPSEVDCPLNHLSVSNVAFQAEIQVVQGDPAQDTMQAGLFVRTHDIYFVDAALNVCTFIARSLPPVHVSTACTLSPARTAANVLCVIALQHLFYLYLNQVYLTTVSNEQFRSGSLGVFLLNADPANVHLKVSFTNVRVWLL